MSFVRTLTPLFLLLILGLAVSSTVARQTAIPPPLKSTEQRCREVSFDVSGAANNRNISNARFDDPNALYAQIQADAWPRIAVSGSQSLVGWYCEPTHRNSNNDKLQVLFGSITTNRDLYNAQGGSGLYSFDSYKPEIYSWIRYAGAQGYPTLSMDRLGSGKSSHPDPVLVTQGAYEYALYHDLAQQLRRPNSPLRVAFRYLIYVGNSYGSVSGNQISHLYPNDFDAFILTGFTYSILPSLGGITLQDPKPAASIWPARFSTLAQGYVTAPNLTTRTNSFFGSSADVDFESEVARLFWEREDVVSLGQFISAYSDIIGAPEYRGRVLVLTGEQDQAFCGPGSSARGPAGCGSLLRDTRRLYPYAEYSWKSIERTGHALMLHRSAPYSFRVAHNFLAGRRYQG